MSLKDFVNGERLSQFAKLLKLHLLNDLLGGRKLRYVTQEQYNNLSDDEKNDDYIVWNIIDLTPERAFVHVTFDEYYELIRTNSIDNKVTYVIIDIPD